MSSVCRTPSKAGTSARKNERRNRGFKCETTLTGKRTSSRFLRTRTSSGDDPTGHRRLGNSVYATACMRKHQA
jgi:hypothetical protein